MRTENTDTKTNPFSVIVNDYKLDKKSRFLADSVNNARFLQRGFGIKASRNIPVGREVLVSYGRGYWRRG